MHVKSEDVNMGHHLIGWYFDSPVWNKLLPVFRITMKLGKCNYKLNKNIEIYIVEVVD